MNTSFLQHLDGTQGGVGGAAGDRLNREPGDQREEERLQHVAGGQRREQRVGDDRLDELQQAALTVGLLREFAGPAGHIFGHVRGWTPGVSRLPTTRPIASANVDIVTKYTSANPPTLPTVAALRSDPMPSTIVQKITGVMIILIRSTNMVPSTPTDLPTDGSSSPTTTPPTTADDHSDIEPVRTVAAFGLLG